MPRYHFTLTNSVVHPDAEGEEQPNLEVAREAAVHYLTEMLLSRIETLWSDGSMSVMISDDEKVDLLEIEVRVSTPGGSGRQEPRP